jgi:hypothetical protein
VKRLLLLWAAALGVASLCGAVPAFAETVTANCDTPGKSDGCNRWYTAAKVTLSWSREPGGGGLISGCQNSSFTAETVRFERECTWSWTDTMVTKRVWIGIDRTAPRIVGLQTARLPDFNGWFNHPVGVVFRGEDPISGVASCSSATYSGPDGEGAPLEGACTDVAGNVAGGTQTLNYDATPPPKPTVSVLPGNHRVAISWSSAQNEAEIVRVGKASSQEVVYRGATEKFTDRRLRNGRRYRYRVTLIDQAGNRTTAAKSAVPTSRPLLLPANGAHLRSAPMLAWKRVRHARYYNAQLIRAGRKVLSRWPRKTRLQLHERWRFQGRVHRLVRGHYCWYVWPGFGPRSQRNYGSRPLGKSCFTVTR